VNSDQFREELRAGYEGAKIKSHKDALLRALIHGAIIGIAIAYPAVWWKRVVGALVAFFVVGVVGQVRAIRRDRRSPDASDPDSRGPARGFYAFACGRG
jgi:hypothetical protein